MPGIISEIHITDFKLNSTELVAFQNGAKTIWNMPTGQKLLGTLNRATIMAPVHLGTVTIMVLFTSKGEDVRGKQLSKLTQNIRRGIETDTMIKMCIMINCLDTTTLIQFHLKLIICSNIMHDCMATAKLTSEEVCLSI